MNSQMDSYPSLEAPARKGANMSLMYTKLCFVVLVKTRHPEVLCVAGTVVGVGNSSKQRSFGLAPVRTLTSHATGSHRISEHSV